MIRHGDVSASFWQCGYEGGDETEITITCTGLECPYSSVQGGKCRAESGATPDGEFAPCTYFPGKAAALEAMIYMLSEYLRALTHEHETGVPWWMTPDHCDWRNRQK